MKFVAFSLVSLILLADNVFAKEKALLENISLISGIMASIAIIAGVIIAYLTYRRNIKKEEEKQLEAANVNIGTWIVIFPFAPSGKGKQLGEQKIIVAADVTSNEAKFEKSKIGKKEARRDIYKIDKQKEEQPKFKIEKQEAQRDIYQAGGDIKITYQPPSKMEPLTFPSPPSLHNQTLPEPNFVGRKEMLETITDWYTNPEVRIGALIGWGGVGKSAIVRKWYDTLDSNAIKPDGIFWWGFYRNAYLEQFLNALLRFVSQGRIKPETIKSTWKKIERIKEYIHQGTYLIILDGLEQMQKPVSGDEFGKMIHRECTELLHYLADVSKGLCLITSRYPLKDLEDWHERSYKKRTLIDLSIPDSLLMLRSRGIKGSDKALTEVRGIKGSDKALTEVITRYKGHTLSLTSLAGYLKRYPEGDIKKAPEVEFILGDKDRFNKLLHKYAEKMSESEQISLYIFSLFRQEVTENEFAGVFRHEIEDTKFNEVLIKMSKYSPPVDQGLFRIRF
jgi:preprotein translocase subunit YajC